MSTINFIRSFVSRLRDSAYIDPVRDWLIILTLFIFAFAGIVVWNVWAFDTVARGGVIGTSATSTQPVFNGSSIDAIHSVFEKRSAEEAKYITGVYRYADPSQ
ncbi:hypothetical protein HYT04_01525 [Candidatus Kaiserbacteria bacterium]|nr:hypothetical protein [Candidatus Kaiserbacteria bacterium]